MEEADTATEAEGSQEGSDEGMGDVVIEDEDTSSTAESIPPLEEEEGDGETITYVVIRGLQEERYASRLKLNDWISENISEPHRVQIMLDGTVRVTIKEGRTLR